jgi:hypothetical protein
LRAFRRNLHWPCGPSSSATPARHPGKDLSVKWAHRLSRYLQGGRRVFGRARWMLVRWQHHQRTVEQPVRRRHGNAYRAGMG